MPHKDPEARKAYFIAYYATEKGKENRRKSNENLRAARSDPQWKEEAYALNIWKLYGITIQQYRELYEKQCGRCAICGAHQDQFRQRLSVDHCHATGVIRGLLCLHCNHAIGKFKDDPAILRAAADYLEATPPILSVAEKPARAAYGSRQPGGALAEAA